MSKIYKGYELIKEVEEGNLKEGTILKDSIRQYIIASGHIKHYVEKEKGKYIDCWNLINNTFELIEENTIDSIEELNHYTVISAIEGKTEKNIDDELGKYSLAFNKLLQWAKQIDKKLKEKE